MRRWARAFAGVFFFALLVAGTSAESASLTSISVSPASATATAGGSQAFTAIGYFSDGSTQSLSGGAWTRGPDDLNPRYLPSGAYAGGKFYAIGGSNTSNPQGTLTADVFDPAAGAWSAIAAPPIKRVHAGAATVGGIIYVMGGCLNSDCSFPTAANWAYNPSSNTWTQMASMPTARFSPAVAEINGKIYVAGGDVYSYKAASVLEVYDPATNTWATKASLPQPRGFAAAGSAGGKLYVAGGTDNPQGQPFHPVAGTFVYDPGADSWTTAAPLPEALASSGYASLDGRFYVVSGDRPDLTMSTATYVYDPGSDSWSLGPAVNDPRYYPATAAGGGRLFVTGWPDPNHDSASFESLPIGGTWSSDAPAVATVTAWGVATGVAGGSAHIVASSGAVTGSASLTVIAPPSLTSITVSPANANVASGGSQAFAATGHFSDGSSRALSGAGAWTRGSDAPNPRYLPTGAYAAGRFYAIGGSNTSNPQGTLTADAFDPIAGTWTAIAPPPIKRVHAGAATVGGIIYVMGGCLNSDCSFPTAANWAYNPSSNTWTQMASMSTARFSPAVAEINGKIYVAGGDVYSYAASSVLEVYDPATNTWATKASLPQPRGFAAAGSIGGKLYLTGGTDNPQGQPFHPVTGTFVYDPAGDSWTTAAPLPQPLAEPGYAALDGKLYIAGGETPAMTPSTATFVYDPAANAWSVGPGLNDPRLYPAAAAGDGRFFVMGGVSANSDSASFELLRIEPGVTWASDAPSVATVSAAGAATAVSAGTAHIAASSGAISGSATLTVSAPPAAVTLTSITVAPSTASLTVGASRAFSATGHFSDGSVRALSGGDAWVQGPGMGQPRYVASGAYVAGRFYAIGGTNATDRQGLQSVEYFDVASGTWAPVASEPVKRVEAPTAVVGGTIYVLGGCLNSDCSFPTSANWAYDTVANTWSQKASMPTARFAMQVGVIGGKIYVAGGDVPFFAASSALEVYDPATDSWSTKAPLPAPRGYGSAGVVGGKLYLAGGTDNAQGQPFHPVAGTFVYDPVADAWSSASAMPQAAAIGGSAALDGKFYVLGGQTSSGALSTGTYVYDPLADAWTPGPALNDVYYYPITGAGDGKVFIAGSPGPNVDSTSFEFLPAGPGVAWTSDAPSVATVTAFGTATGLSAGSAHVVASSGAVTGSAALTVSAPLSAPALTSITVSPSTAALLVGQSASFSATGHFADGSTRTLSVGGAWARGPDSSYPRYLPSGAFAGGKFYAIGGSNTSTPQGTLTAESFDPATGAWATIAPPPIKRVHAGAATVGGIIYVMGGCLNSDCSFPTTANWAYNPSSNTWTQMAPMPTARFSMAVAEINGKIYAAGGDVYFYSASSVLEVYDPATNTWATKASLPQPRGFAAAGSAGGKLYVSGGTDNPQGQPFHPVAETFVYDPAGDSWTTAAPLPEALASSGYASLDGKFYVVSGERPDLTLSTGTFVYDPAQDAWSLGPVVNDPRYYPATAAGGGQLFVTGWPDPNHSSASFESLRIEPGVAWTSDAPSVATVTAFGTATGLAAGSAHVVASSGAISGSASLTVSAPNAPPALTSITVTPASATVTAGGSQAFAATGRFSDGSTRALTGTGAWTRGPDDLNPRYLPSGAYAGGKFYAIGGSNTSNPQGTLTADAFDPAAGAWATIAPPPIKRVHASAATVGGIIYVMGGCLNSDCSFPTTANWAYNPSSNTWTQMAPMPTARFSMAVAEINGKIYAAGGDVYFYSASSVLEVYDPATNTWATKASLPQPRGFAAAGSAGGKLYVSGGTDNPQGQPFHPVAGTFVYDPAADSWTTAAPLPEALASSGYASLDGKFYVVSGDRADLTRSTATYVYDPGSDSWSLGPAVNDSRYYPATAAGDGKLFVTGWPDPNHSSASFESLRVGPGVVWTSDAPSVATVTAAGTATGLAAGTAHIVATNGSVSGSALLTVNPVPFSGAALGVSSIAWSWSFSAGQAGYRVLSSTGGDLSGFLSTATLHWTETGLGTNAATTRRLAAYDALGAAAFSPNATVYTRAAPPAGTAAVVEVSSAVLSWSLNGNPAGTFASIERSTNAAAFAAISSSTATSFTDQGLAQCATYYYRVRNYNGDFLPTAYDSTAMVRTSAAAPLPPGSLTAQALAGGAIALTWSASPSSFLRSYRLYMSTDALSYAAVYAELPASATSFTTPALSTAAVYRFGLRAYSACASSDDGNTNVIASATPIAIAAGVTAVIKVPESGKKVSGNRVTVMAEIATGDPRLVKDIRFQFRTAASTFSAWADIPAADVQHPNPAPTAPYFIHWDVTGLANGSYELRAVAELLDATVDPAPASIVIGVDAVNHDTDETVIGGSQQKQETVYNGAQRTVGTADDASGAVIQVTLPAGVVASSTDTLTLLVNPPGAPPPDKSIEAAGQTLQITLGSGQTSLNGAASIVMHYADENGDGIVDGTSFRADRLAIYSYNVASGKWRKESNTVLDRNARTLTATTPHFSLFGLFSPASAGDLASVRVFPVPWVPGDGDANNGKPFVAGDTTSGIVFDNLTEAVRIQVYSATGSLVWEFSTSSSGGRVQWDGRGSGGRDAASGGYLAVISDRGSGARVVRKIAIIR